MPVQRVGPDSNGNYYNAIPAAEWEYQNPIGVALRAQGWRYCGYGTWGVYIALPGKPCWEKAPTAQPNILPPVAPEPGPLGPSNPAVVDDACGCHGRAAPETTKPVSEGPATPAPVATDTTPVASGTKKRFPWWLWVLILLTAAKVTHGADS